MNNNYKNINQMTPEELREIMLKAKSTVGLPAQGSKKFMMPLICEIINRLNAEREINMAVDIYAGGGNISTNLPAYVDKIQINELETGLLNLLKMISAGRLEEVIYLAGILVEKAEKDYLAKYKSNKNNAFAKKYFKYINEDYKAGKDIWRTESSELTAAKGGLRNITKNVPLSAALTLLVVYGSQRNARMKIDLRSGKWPSFVETAKEYVSLITDAMGGKTFGKNNCGKYLSGVTYNWLKRMKKNSSMLTLFAIQARISRKEIKFTNGDALVELKKFARSANNNEHTLILADPPYSCYGKSYQNDNYNNIESVYQLAARLMSAKAPFMLFCDDIGIDAYTFMSAFPDINFFFTNITRDKPAPEQPEVGFQEKVYEVIITNFEIPDISYDNMSDDLRDIVIKDYENAISDKSDIPEERSFEEYANSYRMLRRQISTPAPNIKEFAEYLKNNKYRNLLKKMNLNKK